MSGQEIGALIIVALAVVYLVWKFAFAGRAKKPKPLSRPDVSVASLRKSARRREP